MSYEPLERGPLLDFELTWTNGHVERIKAHQVIVPSGMSSLFGEPKWSDNQIMFHGEVDGRWQLLLAVNASEIKSVRNLTNTEAI